MERSAFLTDSFIHHLQWEATGDQLRLFDTIGRFLTGDDGDILVVNGYAGTGKTTAVSAVLASMRELKVPCVLLAPTGRAAKVLSQYSGMAASTIHTPSVNSTFLKFFGAIFSIKSSLSSPASAKA